MNNNSDLTNNSSDLTNNSSDLCRYGIVLAILCIGVTSVALIVCGNMADGLTLAFFTSLVPKDYTMPEGASKRIGEWRSSYKNKMTNISYLVDTMSQRRDEWGVPDKMLDTLVTKRDELVPLYNECRSSKASLESRTARNLCMVVLKQYIFDHVRTWAVGQIAAEVMSLPDFNLLGFRLTQQLGGARKRSEATKALTRTSLTFDGMDTLQVTVHNSEKTQGRRAKPKGVSFIAIVVIDEEQNVIYNGVTTKTQHIIHLDSKYRKQLLGVKTAFLAHADDVPKFGPMQSISMPWDYSDMRSSMLKKIAETQAQNKG